MSKKQDQLNETPIDFCVLPEGWSWAALGEISLVRLGKTPRKKDYRNSGDFKIIKFRDLKQTGDIDWEKDDKGFVDSSNEVLRTLKELKQEDVLVTASAHMSEHIGKKVGHVVSIPKRYKVAYVVGEILQVRANEGLEPKWLLYYLQSSAGYKAIQRRVHGVHLIGSRAKNIEIPVAPQEQQKRIVAEIEKQFSRLDEAVANLKRVKANLKRYKAAILKAAVEGKLTEEWRKKHLDVEPVSKLLERILAERRKKWEEAELAKMKAKGKTPKDDKWKKKYKEPAEPDTAALPKLPEGWDWSSMDQLSTKITDGEHISPKTTDSGVPLLSAKDVRENGVLLDDAKYVHAVDAEKFRNRCDPALGDILIVSRGATIGRTCQVNIDTTFCLMGSVILIKSIEFLDNRYLVTALKNDSTHKLLLGVSGSTAQQAIYIRDIRSLPIPLPPSEEQLRIYSEVEQLLTISKNIEMLIEANFRRAERLRQSILTQAYSGQLIN